MNNVPGHGQQGQGHGSSGLYNYSNQQDDFSTPFNNDAQGPQPGFTDPSSYLNSNFNSHFDQQMNAEPHENISPDFFNQNGQQSWQPPQYFDPSHMAAYQGLSEPAPAQGFGSSFNNHITAYNDIHDQSSFPSFSTQPSFNDSQRQQGSVQTTINPHAIRTSSDFVYQQPAAVSARGSPSKSERQPSVASEHPRLFPQPAQQQPPQPAGPQRRFLDTDLTQALDAAIPKAEKHGFFSIRSRDSFTAPASLKSIKGFSFINLSDEIYDSAEARVVPPPRRIFWSVNELERKLQGASSEGRDPKVYSLLRSKITKAKQRTKPKASKSRRLIPAAGPTKASVVTTIGEVSEDDVSSSASENESDYSGSDDDVIEDEPSPIPSVRPEDPDGARDYDILKAVWARSAVRIGPDDVKRRLSAFLEVVKKVRTKWKAATDPAGIAAGRQAFEHILRLTVQHGHHNFIESVDQLTPLSVVIGAGLVELLKANAYSDGLLEAMLELVVKIPNINPEFLKNTKMDKYKERISKKTQGRVKDLVSLIEVPGESSASTSGDAKSIQPSDTKLATVSGSSASASRAGPVTSQPAKKPVDLTVAPAKKLTTTLVDLKKPSTGLAAIKKPILGTTAKTTASVPSASAQLKASALAKPGISKPGEKPTTTITNGNGVKTTVRQVNPIKPTSIYAGLTSASKKPGTSISVNAKPVPAKPKPAEQKPTPVPAPVLAAAKPKFSFADTLANLGKAKDEPKKTESTTKRAPESEEERRKRLRKEQRRKLRVTWKPDGELCAIRIFDHRQDDETAHEDSEVADAADLKSEGQAFKRQLRRDNVSAVEIEEDEEQDLVEWHPPTLTDFSSVYERKAGDLDPPPQNVETRAGGSVNLNSPESDEQDKREQTVMVEFYNNIRDVPPCPKEPADPFNGKSISQYDFGPIRDCGTNPPVPARLDDRNKQLLSQYAYQRPSWPEPQVQPQGAADISSLLAMLGQPQAAAQPQYQPPPPQYTAPVQNTTDISALLAQFAQPQIQAPPPQPATNTFDVISLFNSMQNTNQAPAAPMPSVPQPPQPQVPAANADLTSILASLTAANTQNQVQPQPQPQPQAPQQPQQQPQASAEGIPGFDPSLLGWLSQYNAGTSQSNQSQAPQAQPQPQPQPSMGLPATGQTPSATDWLQQLTAAQNLVSNTGSANINDRKRGLEDEGKDANGKKKKKPFYGTPRVICRYFKEGRCQKGPECTFLHE